MSLLLEPNKTIVACTWKTLDGETSILITILGGVFDIIVLFERTTYPILSVWCVTSFGG